MAEIYNLNNPFVENLTTWSTNDVAGTKVHEKIRKEIGKAEFKLAHPPLMYSNAQRRAWSDRLHVDIAYWTSRLSDAHYN